MCSHPRHRLFIKQQYKNSAGQPYSAAEAAFSIASQVHYGLHPKSMPRPRPLKTRFSINMYILVLTPLHLPPRPSFFLFIQGQHFLLFFFFVPAPPEASFCWGVQRAYTAFSNEEGRFAFSLSQSPPFPTWPAACTLALSSSLPFFIMSFPTSIFWGISVLLLSLVLFFMPLFVSAIYIQYALLSPHPSTYLDFYHFFDKRKTFLLSLSRRVGTLRWNVKSIQLLDAPRHYGRWRGR